MLTATDLWHSGEMEATLDVIRLVGLIVLIVANSAKLGAMLKYTKKWNGLGKALRFEKSTHILLWSWVLLRGVIPVLDHPLAFIAIALLIIWAEIRATLALPVADRLRVEAKNVRQDAREVSQNDWEAELHKREERWEQR